MAVKPPPANDSTPPEPSSQPVALKFQCYNDTLQGRDGKRKRRRSEDNDLS